MDTQRDNSVEPTAPIVPEAPAKSGVLRYWYKIPAKIRASILHALTIIATAIAMYFGVPKEVIEVAVPAPQQLIDQTPISYEGLPYHGDEPEHLVEAEPIRWPVDRITYGIDYASARGLNPPLSDDAIKAAFRQAITGWWGSSVELDLVEVPYSQALVPCRFEQIDGAGRTLALAFLPDGTTRPKSMVLDKSERWTAGPPAPNLVSLPTVVCHEFGHSLGLKHDEMGAPAVMQPTYTSAVPREQERDISRAVTELGYKRRTASPPGATDVFPIQVHVKTAEVIEGLRKLGYKVSK